MVPNQRTTTDSAFYRLVTHFFTRLPWTSDLLGAPRRCPPPVLPKSRSSSFPCDHRARNLHALGGRDHAREPILNVMPQIVIRRQLRWLQAPRRSIGVPLRG